MSHLALRRRPRQVPVPAGVGASHRSELSVVSAPHTHFQHDFTRVPVGLQAKGTTSAPGDVLEREADRIAEDVMGMPEASGEEISSMSSVPGGGAPLPSSLRSYFEPRMGRSFADVRVHAEARASASAEAVRARAYTLGSDIVFGAGEFAPQQHGGRRLLAHELAHVMQQGASTQGRLFRKEAPAMSVEPEGVEGELEALLLEITNRTTENLEMRGRLDALPEASSPERETLTTALDAGREALLAALEQRVLLLKREIADLTIAATGEGLASTNENPGNDALGLSLNRYERELQHHENQLRQLRRWQQRQRMKSIDAEIAAIDAELAQLPPVSDPDAPASDLLMARRDELLAERKSLGKSLTSTAVEYKQGDRRWGAIRYGNSSDCTDIATGGCGPSALAMLLNFLYAEDPEAVKAGHLEFVTPDVAATYASTHGRVCNEGTNSATMVTQVATKWPGFVGRSVTLEQAVGELRGGNLVLFGCHSCTGKTKGKKDKSYGKHFMVMNGVDEAGETFNVLDSGTREGGDIETITKTNLTTFGTRYWIIERK